MRKERTSQENLNLSKKKRDIYNKYNDHYSQLEPAKKKQRYSSMDRAKKDELLETCAKNIKK